MNENTEETTFEAALTELEKIVDQIESGGHSLDESLDLFGRGITLTKICSEKLEHARRKIEKFVEGDKIEQLEFD